MASNKQTQAPERQLTAKEKRVAREQELIQKGVEQGRAQAIEDLNKGSIIRPDEVINAHGEKAKPQHAGGKVVVACKLGVAYYAIQLCKIEDKFEQNMQGGRTVKEATRVGDVVQLRGTAYPRGTPPAGFPAAPVVVDGAALNYGIDRNFMVEWLDQHKLDPIVKNRMIFIHDTDDGIRGLAKDFSSETSGLEPIDPKKDKRITKSTRSEVTDVEPGTKQLA